jgi:F-type H+-transporting ATPase subunit alpha
MLGRVVNALGAPLDGALLRPPGPMDAHRGLLDPLVRSDVRVGTHASLATGVRVLDAFAPLARGRSLCILGERGVGKRRLALEIVATSCRRSADAGGMASLSDISAALRTVDGACGVPQWARPTVVVYVAAGVSEAAVSEAVGVLRTCGALPLCTVVAATDRDPLGMQWLAPLSGAAMAQHWAEAGWDALVVYDGLTPHAAVTRQIAGASSSASPSSLPTWHPALLDQCGEWGGGGGRGGSITCVALGDAPDPESTEPTEPAARATLHAASLADATVWLRVPHMRRGCQVPVDLDEVLTRATSAAWQGSALHAYARGLRGVLGELRDMARGAIEASALGLDCRHSPPLPRSHSLLR